MVTRVPDPESLEPIERASVDELRSLQLERLKWSIGHSYDNCAPYRAKCDEVGVVPGDLGEWNLEPAADRRLGIRGLRLSGRASHRFAERQVRPDPRRWG